MDGRPRMAPPSNPPSRPSTGGGGGSAHGRGSAAAAPAQSRAERFDDERRRITESCFAKVDEAGQLHESYITHIRVLEDAGFPQSPPPPGAPTSSKKARLVIISVRSTGRVKLHKARENANGTFSIGKSWPMEELSAVDNYVHSVPRSEQDAKHRQWAGDKGFTVTILKPYYWEAGTSKEKEFFIGSMVKIYHKYTKGNFPILTGFSPTELASLTNGKPHLATAEARAAATSGTPVPTGAPGVSSVFSTPAGPGGPGPPARPLPPKSPAPPSRRPGESPHRGPEDPRRGPSPMGSNPNFRRPPGEQQGPRRPGQPDDQFRPGSRPGTGDEGRRQSPFVPKQGTPPLPDLRQQRSIEQGVRSRPSGDGMRPRPGPGPSSGSGPSPNSGPPPGPPPGPHPGPHLSRDPGPHPGPHPGPNPSRDAIPPTPPFPARTLTPQSSSSEFAGPPRTPETVSIPAALSPGRRPPGDDAQLARSQRSFDSSQEGPTPAIPPLEQRRQNGLPPLRPDQSPRGLRPGTSHSNTSSNITRNDEAPPEEPPQRRRPLMEPRPSQVSQTSLESQAPELRVTHSGSPGPSMDPPPRRRPQEIPERLKSIVPDDSEAPPDRPPPSHPVQPAPPPTAPLPQIPVAPILQQVKSDIVDPAIQTASEETDEVPAISTPTEEREDEVHRPGLGPMVKKSLAQADAASKFRKAAAAAGAFKPRAGGAAAKLFNKEAKASDEPDGVNAVFVPQRPTPKEAPKEEEDMEYTEHIPEVPPKIPDRSSKERPRVSTEAVPSVTVSGPLSPVPAIIIPEVDEMPPPPAPEKSASRKVEAVSEVRRKKRRSNQQMTNISKLGIDPNTIDERGLEFESLLSELGWGSNELSAKNIENLEIDIKREIARVEAGSWLNNLEQKDDRVEAVERMLDRAIAECDELEGLLTLYNVELSSLNDDIAFIEAQSQGLQVQTANQRLLQQELKQLVETISITSDQLEALRRAPIGKINGLKEIEASLVLLYKALITIDPSFVSGGRTRTPEEGLDPLEVRPGFGNSDLATMQALQEKRDRYLSEGAQFLERLKKHMDITFGAAIMTTRDVLSNIDQGPSMPSLKKNVEAHDAGRNELWMLSPIMLFAKEIDRASWDMLLRMYQTQATQLYQQEVRDNILAWQKFARKPTGDEQELLFTAPEKEQESITGTARKLTVKRSQTLARGLRSTSGDKESKVAKPSQDGKLFACDVFARVLDDIGPVLLTEQNFITEFFHATSTDAIDFPEAVHTTPPESRRGPNLWIRKHFEADRAMAKHVTGVMEEIFSFWPTEIQNLVDWACQADPLQGVGILSAVDRKLVDIEDSNQDFLTRNLQKIHERLQGLFSKFLDEQIRAIEDTKVKIKKRKGVIAFMKTFPHFAIAIENMLPPGSDGEQLETRRMVNDGYQRMNKAMFESLKVIAKESPAVMASQGQGDPEDKEALNYHILLIENMNHYIEEVDARSDSVLEYWKTKAQDEYTEHMNLYVDAVIRRPLGKLLEFLESTETLLAQPTTTPAALSQRSSHARPVFKKLAHAHDSKELRKGIEALKKRVDKHFGDADDPAISRDLVWKVLRACEAQYARLAERLEVVNQDVYGGEVDVGWGVREVEAGFRK